jgi:hypothetical protein
MTYDVRAVPTAAFQAAAAECGTAALLGDAEAQFSMGLLTCARDNAEAAGTAAAMIWFRKAGAMLVEPRMKSGSDARNRLCSTETAYSTLLTA